MAHYTNLLMARQDATAKDVETIVETYRGVVETHGGTVEKSETLGVKFLAQRIRRRRKAHVALFDIEVAPAALAEIERQMLVSQDVLRLTSVPAGADEPAGVVSLQGELDSYSSAIVDELRKLNDHLEGRR